MFEKCNVIQKHCFLLRELRLNVTKWMLFWKCCTVSKPASTLVEGALGMFRHICETLLMFKNKVCGATYAGACVFFGDGLPGYSIFLPFWLSRFRGRHSKSSNLKLLTHYINMSPLWFCCFPHADGKSHFAHCNSTPP